MQKSNHATITYSILHEPSFSGQGLYRGVASSYLSSLSKGDTVQIATQKSHAGFSLPAEPEFTPIICVAAGTGIAPFRGFIQERALLIASGRPLAPAILFFGCRSQDIDDLYRNEFDEWQSQGVVEVRRSYSRDPESSDGCRYAQDRMIRDAKLIAELWQGGSNLYICGSRALAKSALETMVKIQLDAERESGSNATLETTQSSFSLLRNVRCFIDVFD